MQISTKKSDSAKTKKKSTPNYSRYIRSQVSPPGTSIYHKRKRNTNTPTQCLLQKDGELYAGFPLQSREPYNRLNDSPPLLLT
mmetsp:Transcript_16399/g.28440  ORF Transcript_16399/g.28440 Transcript_16399/m.28440 type:complete len:83 (+) Transcript_16399:1333-1581(+)